MAKRIKLSRKKGYRKPVDAVNVARPTKWGNPFNWQDFKTSNTSDKKRIAKKSFDLWLKGNFDHTYPIERQWILDHLHELEGKDLACWCGPDEPCHADVLLRLANNLKEVK